MDRLIGNSLYPVNEKISILYVSIKGLKLYPTITSDEIIPIA